MQIQLIAETANLPCFRIAELKNISFDRSISPQKITATISHLHRREPETKVDPVICQLSGGIRTVPEKTVCQIDSMQLETTDYPSSFLIRGLTQREHESCFNYTGREILTPQGPNLPNSILIEHMSQTCILINSLLPEYEGKQFWLRRILKGSFFSDVPFGETVRTRAQVEMTAEKRGTSSISSFLGDAPIATLQLEFVVVRSKKRQN